MMAVKDAVILFHIPIELKRTLVSEARERKLSVTKLINRLIVESLQKKPITTGRGHRADDHKLVVDYLRSIRPKTARKITISQATGIKQDRVLIILNNLSGLQNDYKDGMGNDEFPFLVYECQDNGRTVYGIAKDIEEGIYAY
jgi:hypothetical protein